MIELLHLGQRFMTFWTQSSTLVFFQISKMWSLSDNLSISSEIICKFYKGCVTPIHTVSIGGIHSIQLNSQVIYSVTNPKDHWKFLHGNSKTTIKPPTEWQYLSIQVKLLPTQKPLSWEKDLRHEVLIIQLRKMLKLPDFLKVRKKYKFEIIHSNKHNLFMWMI